MVDIRRAHRRYAADGGRLFAPDEPGLGVRPDSDRLCDPVEVFG